MTRLIVIAAIGIVCFVVIAGATIGSFYLGMNAAKDTYQEAWVKFRTPNNDTIIKERVVVRKSDVDISRPGVIRMVIDYDQNRLVIQSDKELDGDEQVFCYVYDFQPGMFGSKQEAEATVNSKQDTQVVPEAEKFVFESTGLEVPIEDLSPSARQMCAGASIMKVRHSDNKEARWRRGCRWGCWIACWGGCRWVCGVRCTWG